MFVKIIAMLFIIIIMASTNNIMLSCMSYKCGDGKIMLTEHDKNPIFSCEKQTYKLSDKYFIEYPQINYPNNIHMQNKINAILQEYAFDDYDGFRVPESQFQNSKYTVQFEVKLINENYLSILFILDRYMYGAARSYSKMVTVNLDMKTGTILQLSDLYNIDGIYELIENKEYIVSNFFDSVNLSEVIISLKNFYLTEDKLGVIGELQFGDTFVFFEVPYLVLKALKK